MDSNIESGIGITDMLLTATELGYGTLWIANTVYAYQELVQYLSISGQLICAVALGVPDETPDPRPRKGIAFKTLDMLVQDAKKRGITQISLEATDMGRPLYEKYGFVPMNAEMELK